MISLAGGLTLAIPENSGRGEGSSLSSLIPPPVNPLTPRDHTHPDFIPLPQEGWRDVGMLIAQRGPLLKEHQILTQRLQGLMEEVKKCALESSER